MLDTQIPDKRIYKETSNPPATNLPFGWPSTIVPSDVQHLEVAPSQLQRGFRIQRAWNSEWVVVPGNTGNWCLFVWMLLDFSVVNWKNPSRAIGRIRSAPPKIFRPISHVKQRCGGCKNAYGSDCTTPLQSFGPTKLISTVFVAQKSNHPYCHLVVPPSTMIAYLHWLYRTYIYIHRIPRGSLKKIIQIH